MYRINAAFRLWDATLFESILLFEDLHLQLVLLLQDGNGYIDEQELDALLKDLYQKHKMVIFSIYWKNSDLVKLIIYVEILPTC